MEQDRQDAFETKVNDRLREIRDIVLITSTNVEHVMRENTSAAEIGYPRCAARETEITSIKTTLTWLKRTALGAALVYAANWGFDAVKAAQAVAVTPMLIP